jgi:light-regulated signal transduction histidine kinase (bacteriophytochrome)
VKDRTSALEEANRELEAFTYSVSHDLRAPLRHIDGYAQLLRQNPDLTMGGEAKRHLDVITSSAKRMGRLIDDLLQFSRMNRGDLRHYEWEMNDLVKEVISEMSLATENRTIDWKIAPLPRVCADRPMLKQVMANLVSNAVKYTSQRDHTEIEVGFNERPDEWEFFIRDNGAGFDMRYVDKLFGVFQRLHNESEFEGTGIGLANVRRIINRHGGRTWAEGKVDEGATFRFTLPRRRPTSREATNGSPSNK